MPEQLVQILEPAPEQSETVVLSAEEVNTLRQKISWLITTVANQIDWAENPMPYTTLHRPPEGGEIGELENTRNALEVFLAALPESGQPCDLQYLQPYYDSALATTSDVQETITHSHWQVLSLYKDYEVFRAK